MLQYWLAVLVEAHRITWRWMFGSWREVIANSAIFCMAVFALRWLGTEAQMNDQIAWVQAVLVAAAITYVPLILINLVRVPALRDLNAKTQINSLNELAGKSSKVPSLAIGFEVLEYDSKGSFRDSDVCRIWIETREDVSVSNCRVLIESISPKEIVKPGTRLLPDVRHSSDLDFDLAATERRYLKFIVLYEDSLYERTKKFIVRSSQESTDGIIAAVERKSVLEFEERFIVTIAAHARGAVSARLCLEIMAYDVDNIKVVEADVAKLKDALAA